MVVAATRTATDCFREHSSKVLMLMQNSPGRGASSHRDAQKAAYIRSAKKSVADKRTVLELVKSKVDRAVSSGRIIRSDQLANAERRADSCLAAVENCIERLRTDVDGSWERARIKTDCALDELSISVKQMVARFT